LGEGKERGNPFHHNVLFFFGLGSYKWGFVCLYLFDTIIRKKALGIPSLQAFAISD
jgi:hypothetical protein